MKRICLLLLLVLICCINAQDCHTVKQGNHYDSLLPFHGFRLKTTMLARIQFKNDTAHYLFTPEEPKGMMCSVSWNKLYGASRCGVFVGPHDDSDRFVWRRSSECLIFNGTKVIGEKKDCPQSYLIELAAYAYDGGKKPIEHPDLLKIFTTRVNVEKWYRYKLEFDSAKTVYSLMEDTGAVLETQTIIHRSCSSYDKGSKLMLYFGGQCAAPQDVNVCYQEF